MFAFLLRHYYEEGDKKRHGRRGGGAPNKETLLHGIIRTHALKEQNAETNSPSLYYYDGLDYGSTS